MTLKVILVSFPYIYNKCVFFEKSIHFLTYPPNSKHSLLIFHPFCKCLQNTKFLWAKCEGPLQSSWTHLITPSRNFVECGDGAMNFLQRSTHIWKTCCKPLIISKFLASELHFRVWKSSEIAWGEIWIEFCVRFGKTWIGGTPLEHPPYSSDLAPWDFWAFPTMKKELRSKKFRSGQRFAARFREVGGAL
jgi:hypothetical protein